MIEEIELTPLESRGALVEFFEGPHKPRKPAFLRGLHDILFFVGLPAAVAFFYFFIVAANYYVSEAKFVVRTNGGNLQGLESLVQSQGMSRSSDETYVVDEFLDTRDMVRQLVRDDHLLEIFNRPESDIITRFPNFYTRNDFDRLYRHYQNWTHVDLNEGTAITTVRADAYRPQDARTLLSAILRHAEQFINRLNVRAQQDAVRYANLFVDEERQKVANVEARLTQFRNASGSIDPSKESLVAIETIGQLETQVAKLEAQFQQQTAMMPSSPGAIDLKLKIKSYRDEIDQLRNRIGAGSGATAANLAKFESLVLERDLAAKSLEAAQSNLNNADQGAEQQHLYLETISEPNLPDTPERRERSLWFLGIVAVSVGIWSVQRSLRRSATEHSAS
ncbi:MAG: hypothetical protein WDN02_13045 [Methylovirgula sp.]|uniref:hypothetical protein n=1 Tax=Methylovirgula sp. TaxID=1978224 RepID=UPI00307640B4